MGENGKFEFRINIPTFTISLTKAQLMMIIELAKSWTHDNPRSLNQFLVDDVFSPKGIDLQIFVYWLSRGIYIFNEYPLIVS